MENVIKRVGGNSIIILFVMVVLVSTVYMGLSERKLVMNSNNISNIAK